ncbi:MAG: PIG-L family deacetylase [Actinobacteria bacterium]|nr:PIG-L family deacetylase [Actinomycetota bacterium]
MPAADLVPLPDDWERALALVAHPDDLEYGTASAVARWTSEGRNVTYVMATRGEAGLGDVPPEEAAPLREQEQRNSAAVVGVDEIEFLDHPDGVVEYGLALRRDFAAAIRRHRPQVVVTLNRHESWGGPSFNMADHRHVGLAVLDAVRDAANRWVFRELVAEGLDPWDGVTMVCFSGSPHATHAVDVTGFLDQGIRSLHEHRSYLDHVGTDADAWLRTLAEEAGRRSGCQHAVAVEVVRP